MRAHQPSQKGSQRRAIHWELWPAGLQLPIAGVILFPVNLITCAKQCGSNRCFGLEPLQCCHSDCSGGCFGPSPDECYGCKKFENDGRCVDHCPPQKIYDPETFQERDNPNAKLAYGTMCVTECPGAMLKNDGNCLRDCPEGRMDKERECVPCDGPCPKSMIVLYCSDGYI